MSQRPSLRLIATLAAIGSLGPFTIDTYLPALPGMVDSLGASVSAVQWTIAAYLVGVAIFPLFISPLSDTMGRKPVMYGALGAFCAISLACAFAPTIEWLIALRVAQAAAGGSVMTLARAVLADLYRGDALSRAMSYLMLVFTTAPIIAPLIGGVVLELGDWRWIFGFLAMIGMVITALATTLPETLPEEARKPFSIRGAVAGYVSLASNPMAHRYLVATFWSAVFFFAMLSGAPFIFVDHFGATPLDFAWSFAAISAAALIGNMVNMRLVMRRGYPRMMRDAFCVMVFLSIVMAIVAATGWGGLWGVFGVMVWLMAAFHIITANTTAGLMDQLGHQAGGASAVLALFRFSGGAIGSGVIGLFGSSHPWTFAVMLGVATAGMLSSLLLGRQ